MIFHVLTGPSYVNATRFFFGGSCSLTPSGAGRLTLTDDVTPFELESLLESVE